ncbi:MAG TPA: hypothetical protein VG871_13610 [Vicinamibacterales bacterium]|nr:hypothetical protein [Vicinamibacterales bacterium]
MLVVRRGLDADYYRFLGIIAKANRIELVIDRRREQRRWDRRLITTERRRQDRRRPWSPPIDHDLIRIVD